MVQPHMGYQRWVDGRGEFTWELVLGRVGGILGRWHSY